MPRPADLDLCSAPSHRLMALLRPPCPLKKNIPVHPCFAICMVFRRQIKLSAYSATSPGWNEPPPILQQLVSYKFFHQIRWVPLGFKIFLVLFCLILNAVFRTNNRFISKEKYLLSGSTCIARRPELKLLYYQYWYIEYLQSVLVYSEGIYSYQYW